MSEQGSSALPGADEIEFDQREFPLVVVRFAPNVTDDGLGAYLARLTANLDRAEREGRMMGLLFDATRSGMLNATQRRRQADWTRDYFIRSRRWCVGFAFVIHSKVIRGLLEAILWLSPLPSPHVVVSSEEEARAWLLDRLDHLDHLDHLEG